MARCSNFSNPCVLNVSLRIPPAPSAQYSDPFPTHHLLSSLDPLSLLTVTPTDLRSLFDVFARLEGGTSVCLEPATSSSDCSAGSANHLPATTCLGLYSSGSTGTPKLVWREWGQLKSELRLNPGNHGWTWASQFAPCSFAGVQAALQAWASKGSIISIASDWARVWQVLAEQKVDALCCTPTFLDLALQQTAAPLWIPRQITLGGEPLRSTAGTRFVTAFPKTRFTIIYASAEFGVLLKTHRLDGWYEIASLERRFPQWRVTDGALEILKSGSWRATGDLAEVKGALMRVVGRADAVANVAGSKVSLEAVSSVAEQVPGVRAAVAFAQPSAIAGQVVALRFAVDPAYSSAEVRQRLEDHLRQNLRKEAWPRHFEIGAIELGPNAKRTLKPARQ